MSVDTETIVKSTPMNSQEAQDEGLLRMGWAGGKLMHGFKITLANGDVTLVPNKGDKAAEFGGRDL